MRFGEVLRRISEAYKAKSKALIGQIITKSSFLMSERAITEQIKEMMLVLIMAGILIPLGMVFYLSANTDLWTDQMKTIWDYIPVMVFVGILISVLTYAFGKKR